MKAIRVNQFGGPEVLQLKNVPDPEPGPNQVLVHISAVGVNPVDTYIRTGKYPNAAVPYTPGSDAAGTIAKLGPGVTGFESGARVYTSGSVTGTYASMAVCNVTDVHPLPANVSFAQGAALGVPYATAWRALFQRAWAIPGETVLIHGASGGVGTAAVQLGRAAGLTIIGTAGSENGEKLVRELGAAYVLNHRQPDYLKEVLKITDGRGVDAIIEMLSNVNLGKDLEVLARDGRVVVVGSRGPVEINPRELMVRDAEIRGMSLFNTSPRDKAAIHAALRAGLENGSVKPTVAREFALAEARTAHQAVMETGAAGKIVLVP